MKKHGPLFPPTTLCDNIKVCWTRTFLGMPSLKATQVLDLGLAPHMGLVSLHGLCMLL